VIDGLTEAEAVNNPEKLRASFLPLEAFVDPELDPHTPEEWVALGCASGGTLALTPMYNIFQVGGGGQELSRLACRVLRRRSLDCAVADLMG
jgi:hypothetical protein